MCLNFFDTSINLARLRCTYKKMVACLRQTLLQVVLLEYIYVK
ncbi:hypothetical protein NC652_004023 [Populus alba x Populus x berolinensis]|nr:hypothetical protein NC652_004023 [Populus alba x Populus x berolinensis]